MSTSQMKTLIFAQPESPLVKSFQEKGPVFVINEEKAIKALQAMKNIKVRGEYQVVADEQSTKYLEIAKKMGYNEYKAIKEVKEITPPIFETALDVINTGYHSKLESETKRLEDEYKAKVDILTKEYQEKQTKYEKEIDSMTKIKKIIKKTVYG